MSKNKKTTYKLEKFFPTKCPKCLNNFKENGKDFMNYPVSLAKKMIADFPQLYYIEDFVLLNRFDSEIITCSHCENIIFKINYASFRTYSKERADDLIQEGCFNSISEGVTYYEDESYLEETEGLSTLSKIAELELETFKHKSDKKEIDRFSKMDPLLKRIILSNRVEKNKIKLFDGYLHDIFISFTDESIALKICNLLEQPDMGFKCWFAKRDIPSGVSYPGAITRAIKSARVVVFILTRGCNDSPHILRELDQAIEEGIPIITFRTEDIELNDDLKYLLKTIQWLDAFPPPIENYFLKLVDDIKKTLKEKTLENS